MTYEALRQLANTGAIDPGVLVFTSEGADYLPAGKIPGLFPGDVVS